MSQHWDSLKKSSWYRDWTNELKFCVNALERANL